MMEDESQRNAQLGKYGSRRKKVTMPRLHRQMAQGESAVHARHLADGAGWEGVGVDRVGDAWIGDVDTASGGLQLQLLLLGSAALFRGL
jgi:hypothetical protein